MIALKCPSCSADISLDDSRDYGFCTYCGSKILLRKKTGAAHSLEDELNAELGIVKRLLNSKMWKDARVKLKSILKVRPDSAEAWLYDAYAECMGDLKIRYTRFGPHSKDQVIDYLLNHFDQTTGSQKAQQLMGIKKLPLYDTLKKKYSGAAAEFLGMIEAATSRFIQDVQRNPSLLDGYTGNGVFQDEDSFNDFGFFMHGNQLMFYEARSSSYYTVDSMKNGTIYMTFDLCSSYTHFRTYSKHIKADIDFLYGDQVILSYYGTLNMNKPGASLYKQDYERLRKARRSPLTCRKCGAAIILGICKNKCFTHIK